MVFAAFAVEAFVNELGAILADAAVNGAEPIPPLYKKTASVIATIGQKATTMDKAVAAYATLSSHDGVRGREPFQSLQQLMRIRNSIGHTRTGTPDDHRLPKQLRPLERAGLLFEVTDESTTYWRSRILTDGIADWACRTSLSVIRTVLDAVPASRIHNGVDRMREQFSGPAVSSLLGNCTRTYG